MPFVRRTPKLSSRLFIWGTWAFFACLIYLCLSLLLSLAGQEWPSLFSTPQDVVSIQTTVPAEPPPGSVFARPTSILDQSVTKGSQGDRNQVRQLMSEGR